MLDRKGGWWVLILRGILLFCLIATQVLHSTGQGERATQLADTVADERLRIFSLFSAKDMRRFLALMRESTLSTM